jgi:hypothetical protein
MFLLSAAKFYYLIFYKMYAIQKKLLLSTISLYISSENLHKPPLRNDFYFF